MGAEPNITLIDRIEERLQALGISERKASMLAIGKPDLIRDIRRGREPGSARLASLASALQTTSDYLLGVSDLIAQDVGSDASSSRPVPHPLEMPADIPVYGTAIGGEARFASSFDGDVAVEQTDINHGEVIDRFRRPPKLINRRDIYALYVAGSSMEPAFESGRGILIDPKRPPAVRDYVVVYLRSQAEDTDPVAAVLIKRLVRRSASYVELEQFNPAATFKIDLKSIREMHRVMPWDEAFGI